MLSSKLHPLAHHLNPSFAEDYYCDGCENVEMMYCTCDHEFAKAKAVIRGHITSHGPTAITAYLDAKIAQLPSLRAETTEEEELDYESSPREQAFWEIVALIVMIPITTHYHHLARWYHEFLISNNCRCRDSLKEKILKTGDSNLIASIGTSSI